MRRILGLALFGLAATSAFANVITFDEFAADNTNGGMPANRYLSLGITFVATDDGSSWDGIAGGDPGSWAISGTNGDRFSGFNGASYGLTTTFSTNVSGFNLDVTRSAGSSANDTFTLEGWLGGSMVETHTVTLNTINQWQTVTLASVVDKTVWKGANSTGGFHPYGIDNVRWNGVPEPTSMLALGLGAVALIRRRRTKSA